MSGFNHKRTQDAIDTPFDPNKEPDCEFTKDNVQEVIEELCNRILTSASPGFSFGRSGNSSNGTFLLRTGNVPSNRTGTTFNLFNGSLDKISVGTENLNTYDLTIFYHDGNFINPVTIATVSITSSRSEVLEKGVDFTEINPPLINKQIAVQITSGSAKNIGVDLELSGTTVA